MYDRSPNFLSALAHCCISLLKTVRAAKSRNQNKGQGIPLAEKHQWMHLTDEAQADNSIELAEQQAATLQWGMDLYMHPQRPTSACRSLPVRLQSNCIRHIDRSMLRTRSR
jgi:hypothetical protein